MHRSQRAPHSLRRLCAALLATISTACTVEEEPGGNGGRGGRGNDQPDSSSPGGAGGTPGVGGASGSFGASGAFGAGGGGAVGTGGTGSGGAAGTTGGTGGAGNGGASGTGGGDTGGTSGGLAGSAGTGGSSGAPDGGTGGIAGTAGSAGTSGTGGGTGAGCTPAPSGTFQTTTVTATGPDGLYTIHRPTTLGQGGFKHPPVAWGNGLGTTPPLYAALLNNLASNGFVVIANPGPGSNPQVVRQGLEWLIAQNASGQYAGMLAVNCAGTIGYSMGGGAAVGSGAHPAVKAIVSIHGLQDAAERASGPILLTTSEGDTFVTKSGFVVPCYNRSSVQPTILASHAGGDHLDPLGAGGEDAAPAVAWLRYWIYGDQAQRNWFFGASCRLCSWPDFRRKNHTWD